LHKVSYRFEDFEALGMALDAEDTDLELDEAERVVDGQWLLATFLVGEESTSIAGRVIDRGDALRLRFEEHDRLRLCHFANGNGRASLRPSSPELELPAKSRALVVSGSAPIADMVSELLGNWGAQVAKLSSVEDALDWLRENGVDVVVLDATLPGLDYCDLCRELAQAGDASRPSVLLLGQDPTCADAHAALAAGADDFVQKPFRAQELRARLVGLLECRERACG
jgi:CheY-like chemotaxis protein